MSVRWVRQHDPRYGIERAFWLVDVDVRQPEGRRRRVRKVSPVPTRRGAEEYERRLRASLLDPHSARQSPTFDSFAERWLAIYPMAAGNRPTTTREKQIHVRVHLLPAFRRVTLDAIHGAALDRFVAQLREGGASPKTVLNVLTTLRRMLASAVEWGELRAVPAIRRPRVPQPAFTFLASSESERLIAACETPEERALVLFALHTGARAGEQLAVEWRDIDAGRVTFRRSSTSGVVGPTKSGRERHVPLTRELRAALHDIRHTRSARVFCRSAGRPLTLHVLHAVLGRMLARAGLPHMRWHDLRHTFASRLAAAGVPLRQIQAWLGHSTITMTMRYAHLAPSPGVDWIRTLEGSAPGLALPASSAA